MKDYFTFPKAPALLEPTAHLSQMAPNTASVLTGSNWLTVTHITVLRGYPGIYNFITSMCSSSL